MDNRPIGVFDSGLGGLTVVKEISKLLPKEKVIYLGDTARVPYGTRSREIVIKFALEDANFLISKKVKCVVVACNTASAHAANTLRKNVKAPVFDAITPTARKVGMRDIGKIAVIGTRGTVNSHAYQKEIFKQNKKIKVLEKACPLLVPAIEENEISSELILFLIKKYLAQLKRSEIDVLVLGCTHYPIIKNRISQFMGKRIELVDPAKEIALELKMFLEENNMEKRKDSSNNNEYFVTDLTERFTKVAEMFLGKKISGKTKKVLLG